jgi:tetratricopeptide (TPR) repeat protein
MILGHMGNCEAACQPLIESIQLMRQLYMSTGLAWTIYELGRAYARCGNHEQAIPLLQEGLALARSIHEGTGMACSHHWLGRMALKHAQLHATTEHFRHSIELFYRADNRNGVLEVLPSIAEYLGQIGQPEQAACLLAAASNLRQQLALPAQPIEIEEAHAIEEGIRFRMSTTEFDAATMRGTHLSYEQAYALARDLVG